MFNFRSGFLANIPRISIPQIVGVNQQSDSHDTIFVGKRMCCLATAIARNEYFKQKKI